MSGITILQKAKAKLLVEQPFYAALIMATPLIECRDIPTAATDMRKIYYNPEFFAKLTFRQVMFVLAHEVMHVALMHGLRLRGRIPQVWNWATDYPINWMLHKSGFELVPDILFEKKYGENGAEVNYELFLKDLPPPVGGGGGSGEQPSGGDKDQKSGGGNGPQRPPQNFKSPQPNVLEGDVCAPKDMTPIEEATIRADIQRRVANAATIARQAGKMSAELERLIDSIMTPAVPWLDLLRDLMLQTVYEGTDWNRRNRRFNDFYLPGRFDRQMNDIILIGDTSGSMNEEDFGHVKAEVFALADQVRPKSMRMLWADTKVAREQVFDIGDDIQLAPKGGGGTDMRVPLEYAEQYDPFLVIMFTDCETPWPSSEPPFPLIVISTTDKTAPIGHTINV